ncbi:otolin-1-like isoform X2 [Mizuhopecten yessoensis]|uniref:otolin-1-like isoform X2 n=1 Tax=Mizuhopecten yessoensis TaxID=6573 RepID=UPI000B458EE5|nr:otolin-1-like isoform X2 [Mizuhopecten yessoensis]
MYVILIFVLFITAMKGEAVTEKDFQDLQNQMMTLKNIFQHMVSEFGGLRQQHSRLEYRYQTLSEEIRNIRRIPVTQGHKGEKGDTGLRGPKGDNGISGFNGDDGTDGPPGQKGEKGVIGLRGPKGDNGIPGFNGDDGIDGTPGQKGERGDVGLSGPKGDNGIPGLNGQKGEPGKSCDAGPPGHHGSQGVDGPSGPRGPHDPLGSHGDAGPPGPRGFEGDSGSHGPVGMQGTNVGFSARMSHQNQLTKGRAHVLTFQHVQVRLGSDYNPASGVFTCGVPGTYVVTWALEAGSTTYIQSSLMKNGSEIGQLTVTGAIGAPNTGSQMVLVNLGMGDDLYISATPVNLYNSAIIKDGSTFTAFLLHR